MSGDREEHNRVLGFSWGQDSSSRDASGGDASGGDASGRDSRARPAEEPQRVLGFPVARLEQAAQEALRPVREGRRWLRRRK